MPERHGPMRICMIVHSLEGFGGLEDIATTLAVSLRRCGHRTSVLCTVWVRPDNQYKRLLEANGVPLVQWPFMPLVRPVAWARAGIPAWMRERSWSTAATAMRRWEDEVCDDMGWGYLTSKHCAPWTRRLLGWWCWAWRPDLIHIHSYVYQLNIAHLLEWTKARGLPTVFEEHQTPDPASDQWNDFRRQINKATMVGAVSQKGLQVMRDELGVYRPITVLPPIVGDPTASDGGRFEPAARSDARPTISTIAHFIPAKGLPHLFEAIAEVRKTHPALRFRLYGDGPQRKAVRASAAPFGLDTDEVFAGTFRRQDLAAIMKGTDIFVLSSITEGLPLALVEAMACGRPIVATAVGGIPEVVQHEVNGLLCPPADAGSLARALLRLIANPEERARLGRAAREAYQRGSFHPNQACPQYLSMYQETIRIAREDLRR